MNYHCYADDSQNYAFVKSHDGWAATLSDIETCVHQVSGWMEQNMLKLNNSKTEVMFFASKHRNESIDGLSLTVGTHEIRPNAVVRNLGVYWDRNFALLAHVNAVCRSCNFQLRNIGRIRHYITEDACRTLVNALVTSRLDYGNALLSGVPDNVLSRLQRIQNTAARIVTRTPKACHISPVLKMLHWLPVKERIQYKILFYTYKALNDSAPPYIRDLLQQYLPTRTLRSETKHMLCVPKSKTVTYSKRCFKIMAPVLWNSLPYDIKTSESLGVFKKRLKTYLFRSHFE